MKELPEEMAMRTGNIRDSRPLVAFLYELMRAHLPVGTVAQIVETSRLSPRGVQEEIGFANGYLARYAQELAEQLGVSTETASETPRTEATRRL